MILPCHDFLFFINIVSMEYMDMSLESFIKQILTAAGKALSAKEIADTINARELVQREDNAPVTPARIMEQAANQPETFTIYKDTVHLTSDLLQEHLMNEDVESQLRYYFYLVVSYSYDQAIVFSQLSLGMLVAMSVRHLAKEDRVPQDFIPHSSFLSDNVFESPGRYREYIEALNKYYGYRGLFEMVLQENVVTEKLVQVLAHINICIKNTGYERFIRAFDDLFHEFLPQKSQIRTLAPYIDDLLVRLAGLTGKENVYDPFCRHGAFLSAANAQSDGSRIFLQDPEEGYVKSARLNLILHRCFSVTWHKGDPLVSPGVSPNKMGVVGTVPPSGVHSLSSKEKYPFNNEAWGTNQEDLYVQMMLTRLNFKGKMVLAVADRFLHRSSSAPVRRRMVREDILEAVIKLPKPENREEQDFSVIVVNKRKEQARRKKVLIINAGDMAFYTARQQLSGEDQQEQIITQLTSLVEGQTTETDASIKYAWLDDKEIGAANNDLSVIRHTHPVKKILENAQARGEQLVTLRSIVTMPANPKRKNKNKEVPLVTSEALNEDVLDLYLNWDKTAYTKDLPAIVSQVNRSALLVSARGKRLKPTYFDYTGTPIFIGKDVYAFVIDESAVDPEYLIFQLDSEMVQQQLEILRRDEANALIMLQDMLEIKFVLPSIPEQINKAGDYKDRLSSKYLLTSFINEISLVTNNYEVKQEIERFAGKYFDDPHHLEFRTSLEFEEFPFTDADISERRYIKCSNDAYSTYVLLMNQDKIINGILLIQGVVDVDLKTYSEINSYAEFLIRLKEHITKKVANDNMARFAHTSKNLFSGIQGDLYSIIQSKNPQLLHALQTSYTDDEQFIQYKVQKDNARKEDFLAYNKLQSISDKIAAISGFYLKTDKNFKNIVNSEPEHFDIIKEITSVQSITGAFQMKLKAGSIKVFAKREAVKQALVDLVHNALSYSSDQNCYVQVEDKSGFALIRIENPVAEVISEERYRKLGREWVKKGGENLGSGIYWAFQVIEDSYGHIELADYETYKEQKRFVVTIRLKK